MRPADVNGAELPLGGRCKQPTSFPGFDVYAAVDGVRVEDLGVLAL